MIGNNSVAGAAPEPTLSTATGPVVRATWASAERGEARRAPRRAVSLAALISDTGAAENPVLVVDVSASGCRLQGIQVNVEDEIWLGLPGSCPHRCRIVWTRDDLAGCEFYTPLDEWTLKGLIQPAPRHRARFRAPQ